MLETQCFQPADQSDESDAEMGRAEECELPASYVIG